MRIILAVLVALAASAGCVRHQVSVHTTPAPNEHIVEFMPKPLDACQRVTSYFVDVDFDEREKAAIDRGLQAWQRSTGRRECFIAESWLSARLHFVRITQRRDFGTLYGLKDWPMAIGLYEADITSIIIVHEPWHTDGELGALMAHEVGHYLRLEHYSGAEPSVMEPWLSDQKPLLDGDPLPTRDVAAYCEIHEGCDK